MNKVGYLKVLNSGEYFEITQQKRKQGFLPYCSNNLTSKFIEFQSIFNPALTLSEFNHFIFNPIQSFVNKDGFFERNNIHDEFHKYAGKSSFIISLEILKEYHIENYPSNKIMGHFKVRGEMIVAHQLFEFTMQVMPLGVKCDRIYSREDFLEAQTLWNSLQKVENMLKRGYWIPMILPNSNVLEASKEHLERVNDYNAKIRERCHKNNKEI